MKKHFLFPGQVFATHEELILSTLLGSCVAVVLQDTKNKVVGMNHYLLGTNPNPSVENNRYADSAIPSLLREMENCGASRKNITAQVFGGGNVIQSDLGGGIGFRNIEVALKLLGELKIPILNQSVGGNRGRTIHLNSTNYEVLEVFVKDEVDVSGFQKIQDIKGIKVLIVDDSATIRNLFEKIFTKSGLQVVGAANDPYQAREMIQKFKPDVLTLDIEMPKMSGVVFLEKVMAHFPIPVVMVSSLQSTGEAALRSLELGAVEFVHKPSQFDPLILSQLAATLVEKVKAAASVTHLKKRELKKETANINTKNNSPNSLQKLARKNKIEIIVLSGNAGSAAPIETIISSLAIDTPPLLICSSTLTAFLPAYIEKIKAKTKIQCSIAKNGEFLLSGRVYFLPPGFNGQIQKTSAGPQVHLIKPQGAEHQVPSADHLFTSASDNYTGGVFAILVSGFGSDGILGVEKVKDQGGYLVVQNPNTAQFPFASQKSIAMGLSDLVLDAEKISDAILDYRSKVSL
ncbi:MAG TPA: chemotaxis protein CheB [Pseudobdellovibrionaceae bacterium]|nr:chemotaxis protein CheB [Pseudobdellovibrionaceae bacterium]